MRTEDDIFVGCTGEEGELIPILQRVQQRDGYISEESVRKIARFLKVSENQVYGVASFYSQFRFVPPGRHSIRVCLGTACHVRGGQILLEAVQREVGIAPGQTSADGRFDLQRVACLGCCALAPVVEVNEDIHSRVTVIRLKEMLSAYQ
ncbi:MAG: NADH-quinone oxidoreductase subunit NuoE [bacterium]|nr:NADH-quinone oxidoreductase subunit NuoE [candidate division KSB1 bacterium]MDH7561122.1 NADH-quinone oxidoreductase subunit NuoE [bacterium]